MFRVIFVLPILLLSIPTLNAQESPAEPKDMQVLFNGHDLSGWEGDKRLWKVHDGVIRGETTEEIKANGNTFLIWQDGKLSDFDLRLSFRCTNQNNSGIQYRSKHLKNDKARNAWVVQGYQHELRNEVDFPDVPGFIYGEGLGRGRICLVGEKAIAVGKDKQVQATLIDQEGFKKLFRLDDWNDVIIIAKGRNIEHYLNGKLILDFTDGPELALTEGILALQLHAGKPMWAEFKNIRLKSW